MGRVEIVTLTGCPYSRCEGERRKGGSGREEKILSSFSPPPPCSLWLAPSPALFGKFQHGAFASKLHTQKKCLQCRLVSKYLLKWSKSACCFTDYCVLFVLGLHEQITSNKIWLVKFQLRASSTGTYKKKQTIIIVLLVYLDQEVQKSLIERRGAMSGYLGGKISESQQSFAFANNKRKIWASILFLSAIMLRKVTHVNFFRWDTEILLPWQHDETTSPLYHYSRSRLIFNHFLFIIRCMFNIQETVEQREPIQAFQSCLPHWTTCAG